MFLLLQKGIKTDDRQPITMDEITSYFKNKETPQFIGMSVLTNTNIYL